uniref:Peptidase S74 domain-containing protein n=1 Tax=viral metagenome TaxID=1070528 RepID=A0A6C0JZ83_9ZZZZ
MASYNEYIASKRLYAINNIPYSCNSQCIISPGPLYDGGISTGCGTNNYDYYIGPTGPPGDKYLSYFTETFYANVLFENGIIGIVVDKNLAYIPGMRVKCQVVNDVPSNDIVCFYGIVSKYDNGVLIINNINNISGNFPYNIKTNYAININNTGPSISLENTPNQIDIQTIPPATYKFSLNDNVIIGNSISFSQSNTAKITYDASSSANGIVMNSNMKTDAVYFTASGNKNITHTGTNFIINDNIDISGNANVAGNMAINGNTILGDISGSIYSSIYAKLPQIATTLNSYAVRMAFTNISGIFKWQLFASTSSRKQKANIKILPDSTAILDVAPVTYNPIYQLNGEYQCTHIGFIAEEMAKNELGNYFVIRDETGEPKSIQYELMIPVYASAMRNIRTRVEELEKIVQMQDEKINSILSTIAK